MDDFIPHLKPSEETLELFLRQLNGSKRLYWLPWRSAFLYDESSATDLLVSSIEDALPAVYSKALDQTSWPRPEAESKQYWVDLERLEQLMGSPPESVIRFLPGLILGESEEVMLGAAIQERLPPLRYGGEYAKVARALVADLKSSLAREAVCVGIDEGRVRMINGRLAIVIAEVDPAKMYALLEEN